MPVIDDIKESTHKMKGQPFKKKWEYFWEYYKLHVIAIVVGLAVIISIIKAMVTSKPYGFQAALVNAFQAPDATEFAEYAEIDLKEYDVYLDSSYTISFSNTYDNTSYLNIEKLMAVVASKGCDTILGPTEFIDAYKNAGLFGDLRDYFGEDLSSLKGEVLWYTPIDEDTQEELEPIPFAVDISNAPKIANICYYENQYPVYLTIVANAPHPEDAIKFYDFINE